jgi:hypothetical protein
VTVVLLGRDLIIASRVFEAAARAGVDARRVGDPADLPTPDKVRVLLVDWSDREPHWGAEVAKWCASAPESTRPRVLLFGPHTDLVAHAEARAAGLGPMIARSKFVANLATFLSVGG